MMKIRYSISVLILIPILFLSACKVDESKNIRRVLAGDQLLCIHKDYFSWGGDPNSGSVFIVAMRPDMRPETRKERKTLDRDTYYLQKTNILLGPKWEGITERGLKSRKQNHSETGKRKYELIVTENHTNSQAWDLYLEPEHNIEDAKANYINCLDGGNSNVICSSHFGENGIGYVIDYNEKNLQNWNSIKQQVIEFVESKKCE